jgi:hypothetical protein
MWKGKRHLRKVEILLAIQRIEYGLASVEPVLMNFHLLNLQVAHLRQPCD